ncbi:hypothetical protein TB2_014647 [Malus domestica]
MLQSVRAPAFQLSLTSLPKGSVLPFLFSYSVCALLRQPSTLTALSSGFASVSLSLPASLSVSGSLAAFHAAKPSLLLASVFHMRQSLYLSPRCPCQSLLLFLRFCVLTLSFSPCRALGLSRCQRQRLFSASCPKGSPFLPLPDPLLVSCLLPFLSSP